MNVKLKLCGIRRPEDVIFLNEYPPDYAGFIFAETRRKVSLEQAETLCGMLSDRIERVGVFVNMPLEKMAAYGDILDVFQLHGDEDEAYISALREIIPAECEIWKAVRARSADDIRRADSTSADRLLIDAFTPDAYGGTGHTADWDMILSAAPEKPFFAAGGISSENFLEAAEKLRPYGIDISSGIETDGIKDKIKIAEIISLREKLLLHE